MVSAEGRDAKAEEEDGGGGGKETVEAVDADTSKAVDFKAEEGGGSSYAGLLVWLRKQKRFLPVVVAAAAVAVLLLVGGGVVALNARGDGGGSSGGGGGGGIRGSVGSNQTQPGDQPSGCGGGGVTFFGYRTPFSQPRPSGTAASPVLVIPSASSAAGPFGRSYTSLLLRRPQAAATAAATAPPPPPSKQAEPPTSTTTAVTVPVPKPIPSSPRGGVAFPSPDTTATPTATTIPCATCGIVPTLRRKWGGWRKAAAGATVGTGVVLASRRVAERAARATAVALGMWWYR